MKRWLDLKVEESVQFDADSDSGSPYSLLRIAREEWGTHFITHHRPPFLVFLYLIDGRGSWRDDDGEVHAFEAGSFLLHGPHSGPEILTEGDRAMRIVTVFFTARKGVSPYRLFVPSPTVTGKVPDRAVVEDLLEWMLRAGAGANPLAQRICNPALESMLEACRPSQPPERGEGGMAYRQYVKCRAHMQRNVVRITNVEELARECGIDVSYLCRIFRRYDSETPYVCLSRLRMTHAAAMLGNEMLSIGEISATLGYADPYAFSKAFKRVIGVPPRAYREHAFGAKA